MTVLLHMSILCRRRYYGSLQESYISEVALFCKWNTDVIPAFYKAMSNKCLVVMSDQDGNYTEYSINRKIPDPMLRLYLYKNFPSVFVSSFGDWCYKEDNRRERLDNPVADSQPWGRGVYIIKSGLQRKSRYLGSEVPTLFYVVCQTIGWSFKLFYF